jgi:hypothetical protein
MHQTTVRFGPDLWADIEVEAERAGVSVAQYVRDSAMVRVAYTRGRDGDAHYEAALELVAAGRPEPDWSASARADAAALRAETRQARRQAQALRTAAQQRRAGAEAPADAS